MDTDQGTFFNETTEFVKNVQPDQEIESARKRKVSLRQFSVTHVSLQMREKEREAERVAAAQVEMDIDEHEKMMK